MSKIIKWVAAIPVALTGFVGTALANNPLDPGGGNTTLMNVAQNATENFLAFSPTILAVSAIAGIVLISFGLFGVYKIAHSGGAQQGKTLAGAIAALILGGLLLFVVPFANDVSTSFLGNNAKSDLSMLPAVQSNAGG